jgi:hypothetical protein
MSLTYQEALVRLKGMVAFTEEPTLTEANLVDLMRLARTVDRYGTSPDAFEIWTGATVFATGDQVVPTTRGVTGPQSWSSQLYVPPAVPYIAAVVWEAQDAGTSAAAEPAWPDPVVIDTTTIIDNPGVSQITWKAVGTTPWWGAWDLSLAACEGWRRKAALASSGYQFNDQGKALMRNQIFEQCLKMAKEYSKRVRIVSLSHGRVPTGRLIPGVETNWD